MTIRDEYRELVLKASTYKDIFNKSIEEENFKIYKDIIKEWHPDRFLYRNKELIDLAEEISKKLNRFYSEYKKVSGYFLENSYQEKLWISDDNKEMKLKYFRERDFELGKIYISKSFIIYELFSNFDKYFDNYKSIVSKRLIFKDNKMKEEMSKYLPSLKEGFNKVSFRKTKDNFNLIVINKSEDVLSLKDVIAYYKDIKIDSKSICWMISSMYNLACYFQYLGLVHNGISEDNYFISPKYHSGLILGGFWYSTNINSKMIGCKKEIFDILPFEVKRDKLSNFKSDLESIKLLGRKLIECTDKDTLSEILIDWSNSTVLTDDAIEEYKNWGKVLDRVFGEKRVFVPMNLTYRDIYLT